jgi:aspartyl/asparaginyl beta-hydroxylase (cupin superfamily)
LGKPFAFDDTIEHEAFNGSDHLRAVLIFDVWNPHMSELERDMMRKFYATADAAGIPQERQFDG